MGFLRTWLSRKHEADGFLGALKQSERSSVSNLNPIIYQTIVLQKKGEKAPTLLSTDGGDFSLLKELSVTEIETLSKSVQCGQRGDQAAKEGNLAEAMQHYRDAFELNPYNDLALMSYGVALAHQGQLREGITWVQKAVKVNPSSERAKQNLKAMKAAT